MSGPDLEGLCDRVLGLLDEGIEAQVTVTAGRAALTRFANSFIHQNVAEDVLSVELQVAVEGRVAGASSTGTDGAGLRRLVDDVVAAARLRPVDPDWPGVGLPAPLEGEDHHDEETAAAGPQRRAELVRDFVGAGGGMRAAGFCETVALRRAYANTAGRRVQGAMTSATLDGIHQTATSAGSAHCSSATVAALDGAAAGAEAAERARRSKRAEELEPGRYEVVLGPRAVAEIVEFLAAYGFNGKAAVEGQSFARLGELQFDPALSLRDDAGAANAVGFLFDAEGTPKRRLDLVVDGVTTALAHDRRTALQAGTESTGHASSVSGGFGPFPENLFLAPGQSSFDELVSGMRRGLVVNEFNYCRPLDPKTLVVTGLTRNGTFLVERGEVVGAARNLRFTQSFLDALAPGHVLGVGSDAVTVNGRVGAPSLRLASWSFTGGGRG